MSTLVRVLLKSDCRATFILDARKKGEDKEKLISVEGKLDTCGSVSLILLTCSRLGIVVSTALRELFSQE
jgi:hypothetical protein